MSHARFYHPAVISLFDLIKRSAPETESANEKMIAKANNLIRQIDFLDEQHCYYNPSSVDTHMHLNSKDAEGFTLLMRAVQSRNIEIVRLMIRHGADMNLLHHALGLNALLIAVQHQDIEMTQLILSASPDPAAMLAQRHQHSGCNALMFAVTNDNDKMVEYLLKMRADPDVINPKTGKSPLATAISNESVAVAQLLIEKSIAILDFDSDEKRFVRLLQLATLEAKSHLLNFLFDYAAKRDKRFKWNLINARHDEITLLYCAASHGYTDIVAILLKNNADPNLSDAKTNLTPLAVAAMHGHLDVIRLLHNHGANLNLEEVNGGKSPLYVAAEFGQINTLKFLLEYGSHVNFFNLINGNSVLSIAVLNQKQVIVELLLQHGADANFFNHKTLDSCLILTAKSDDVVTMRLLLECKADPNYINRDTKMTALLHAIENHHTHAATLLLEHSSIVTDVNLIHAKTFALHYAVKFKNVKVAELLLAKNARIDAICEQKTALQLALDDPHKSLEIIWLLLRAKAAIPNPSPLQNILILMQKLRPTQRALIDCCLGIVCEKQKNLVQARTYYTQVSVLNKSDIFIQFRLAEIAWQQHEYSNAIVHFKQAAALHDVKSIVRLIDIAQCYAQTSHDEYLHDNSQAIIDSIGATHQYTKFLSDIYSYIAAINYQINLSHQYWEFLIDQGMLFEGSIADGYFLVAAAERLKQQRISMQQDNGVNVERHTHDLSVLTATAHACFTAERELKQAQQTLRHARFTLFERIFDHHATPSLCVANYLEEDDDQESQMSASSLAL